VRTRQCSVVITSDLTTTVLRSNEVCHFSASVFAQVSERNGKLLAWPGSTTPSSARITWYAPQSVANLLLFRIFDRFMVF
jgi:hypothetical protein